MSFFTRGEVWAAARSPKAFWKISVGLAAGCLPGAEVWRARTADVRRGIREKNIF